MTSRTKWIGSAFALLTLTGSSPLLASSHREAPAIAQDPYADNTDLWAWVSKAHDKLYVVAAYNPLEEPSGGPNFHGFSNDVRYDIHITRGQTQDDGSYTYSLDDILDYQIIFHTAPAAHVDPADLSKPIGGGKEFFSQLSGQTQLYDIVKWTVGVGTTTIAKDIPVAPPNIGPRTYSVVQKGANPSTTYDDAFAATFVKDLGAEGRVWAGPRDDGFYVDLGGIFDLANLRAKGTAQDGVAGYNCHAIALEIPTSLLTEDGNPPAAGPSDATTIGVWASASRPSATALFDDNYNPGPAGTYPLRNVTDNTWVQVSRLGLPLVNEALIGIQDKDRYNATFPKTDVANFGAYFLNPVMVRDAEAVGIYAALGVDPTPFKSNRLDIIDIINLKNIPSTGAHAIPLGATGDVLRVDIGVDSGFPNGRPIPGGAKPNQEQADVTDVLLSVILSKGMVAISDGVDYNDKDYLGQFPWLALPWSGYNQGHGKPTP